MIRTDRPHVLIDEDYPVPIARALREWGLASVEFAVEGPLWGVDDRAMVAHAVEQGGVLVSHNQRERAPFLGAPRRTV